MTRYIGWTYANHRGKMDANFEHIGL